MEELNHLKVAVTGATGFVGTHLVKDLLSLDAKVSILVRDRTHLSIDSHENLKVIEGDMFDERAIKELVEDKDVLVHLAAYVHLPTISKGQQESSYRVNFLGTKGIIDICCERENPLFIVFFSTVSVYGNLNGIVDENHECNPDTKYGETKLAAEKYLLDKIKSADLEGCILRPSSIIGENAPGNLLRMIKLIDFGIIPLFNGGNNRKSLIYVDNVIEAAKLVFEKPQISNQQIYNISDDDPLEMAEIVKLISASLEKNPLVLNLPKAPVIYLAAIWDKFAGVFQGRLPLLKRSMEVYTSEDIVDTQKIQKELGYYPKVTVNEGISRMAKAYKKNKLPK